MNKEPHTVVLCNGASSPGNKPRARELTLDYVKRDHATPTIAIGLPEFVGAIYHLPDRLLDLLELAAYVYCADRKTDRGRPNLVEYHSWARSFHFVTRVRDPEFWSREVVLAALQRTLEFMTGDAKYVFSFEPGHRTPPASLFDSSEFQISSTEDVSVVLFSGGLDSLGGTLHLLNETSNHICLVSHRSQQGTRRTQDQLVRALGVHYPGRVSHYKFECHLRKVRAAEETQRTRAFLYSCIAAAVVNAWNHSGFVVCENGITSMNLPRREDLSNARASRTTHPKTISHLQALLSLVLDRDVRIESPLLWKTKTDVITELSNGSHPELIASSVSCSKTFQHLGQHTHCGGCSQCIDRRFAAFAANAHDWDHVGLYKDDIVTQRIPTGDVKTTAVDYVRQARKLATWNVDHFHDEMISELAELLDYMPDCTSDTDVVERVWQLCKRHGQQVAIGMYRMRAMCDDLFETCEQDSLLQLISDREYLKHPVVRMIHSIEEKLSVAIPKMFGSTLPSDERDFNIKVSAILASHKFDLIREHPAVSFATGFSIPDHGNIDIGLVVESKFLRNATSPSKASEGMAADLTKYPLTAHVLFLVYDPRHAIKDDAVFRRDFESKGRCTVIILR